MRIVLTALREPPGWSPPVVAPGRSTRSPGLVATALDAWRGVPERGHGTALTPTQVSLLSAALGAAMLVPVEVVARDLEQVRVLVGGAAHGAGQVATTIGTSIYVSDAARAAHMLSWQGRRWLAHELAHTIQWRRAASPAAGSARRDRVFLERYLGAYVRHDGSVTQGGIAQAVREWQRRREAGEPVGRPGDLLHDTHPMEQEAERVAVAFRDSTR